MKENLSASNASGLSAQRSVFCQCNGLYLCLWLMNYFNLNRDEDYLDTMVCKFTCESIVAK